MSSAELESDIRFHPVDRVALMLGCSPRSVRRYIHDGKLAAVRLGGPDGPLRVRADEVQRFAYRWPVRRRLRSLSTGVGHL